MRPDDKVRISRVRRAAAVSGAGGSLVLLALLLCACGAEPVDDRPGEPLVDDHHAPEVLVESPSFGFQPRLDGNRFLSGWAPTHGEQGALVADPSGARLELVNLAERPRRLVLAVAEAQQGSVAVRAAGRDLGDVPIHDPLVIDLPPDLPLGKVLVELTPRDGDLRVNSVKLDSALEKGRVRLDGKDFVQSGDSRIDLVRRVAAGTELVGTFTPSGDASSSHSFALSIESEDGSVTKAFEWEPGFLWSSGGERAIRVPLPAADGFVRIRLEARGKGGPGRWSGLRLVDPALGPPSTPGSTAPGPLPELVLLYVMDALRADVAATSRHGYARLARSGFTFRDHRSPAPNTLPSVKALLTGEVWLDGGGRALPADGAATLAEGFRQAGYKTALFSGNVYVGQAFGTDRGFEHVEEVPPPVEDAAMSYNDNPERLHAAVLAWLDTLPKGERAFVYVHVLSPHNPYAPPAEPAQPATKPTEGSTSTISGSTRTLLGIQKGRLEIGAADADRLRRLYAATFAHADAELDRFLTALEQRVPADKSLIVATADHGEELLEHDGVLHGFTLYDEVLRIPLVASWPGQVRPGTSYQPTSIVDLHATLAELTATSHPSEGTSLWPLLRGGSTPEREPQVHLAAASSVKGGIFSAQSDKTKLIFAPRLGREWGQGVVRGRSRSLEYLFDLTVDPGEQTNRAGEGGLEAAWLRSRMAGWMSAKQSHEGTREAPVSEQVNRRLEALGYVQ